MIKVLIMRLLHNDIFLADCKTAFKYPPCAVFKGLAGVSYLHGTSFEIQKLRGNELNPNFLMQDQYLEKKEQLKSSVVWAQLVFYLGCFS